MLDQKSYDDIELNNVELESPSIKSPHEPHLACVLLIDTSGSMAGAPLESLNNALNQFKEQVSKDKTAMNRVDVSIIEFNTNVREVQPFTPISEMKPVELQASGMTSMGEAINFAIDKAKERNHFYDQTGVPCFKPWIFMITDGYPTDDINSAINRIKIEESKGTFGKLKFFALGLGDYDKNTMFQLTNRVMEMRDIDFGQIFDWMAKSMVAISVSRVGQEATLERLPENARRADPDRDIDDW